MLVRTALLSMLLGAQLFCAGGPPMMTDGTGTPGNGNWELNIAYKGEYQSLSSRYEAPSMDLNYGLGNTIQLKAEASYVKLTSDDGIGNAKVGVKWRFYEEETLSFSMYPQYTFTPIKKNLDSGIADIKEAFYFPIQMNKQFGSIAVTVDVGYLAVTHNKNYLNSGFLVGYLFMDKMELLAEVYRSVQTDGNDESITLNGGFTYALKPSISALFSVGKEVATASNQKPVLFFIGLQLLFN